MQSSGQKSQTLDKGCIVSVQNSPKKIQNESVQTKEARNAESDRQIYSVSGNGNIKVYETKSSRLRKKVISNVFAEGENNSSSSAVPQLSARVTADLVPGSCRDYKAGSVNKRNLPRAPAEVRTVRYGQRCVVSAEKRKAVGDNKHDLDESKIQFGHKCVFSAEKKKAVGDTGNKQESKIQYGQRNACAQESNLLGNINKHNLVEIKNQCRYRNVVSANDDECVDRTDPTDGESCTQHS
jgi:hypothetical protein